jgi:hypothetical protein
MAMCQPVNVPTEDTGNIPDLLFSTAEHHLAVSSLDVASIPSPFNHKFIINSASVCGPQLVVHAFKYRGDKSAVFFDRPLESLIYLIQAMISTDSMSLRH